MVWRVTVRNRHGIHVRPAAMIVTSLRGLDAEIAFSNATTGRGPALADSLSSIAGLEVGCGQILEARISGPDAEAARDVLAGLASQNFGEDLRPRAARPSEAGGPNGRAAAVRAFGEMPAAAERRAVLAPASRVGMRPPVGEYRPLTPKDELARFNGAVAEVDEFLAEIISDGEAVPGILEAQRMMLADRELQHGVVGRITAGFSAVDAVDDQLTGMARSFDKFTDSYLRERGQDVRSLRRMLLLALLGHRLEQETPDEPRIWVLEELDAATAMRLDPRLCMGVITIAGGSSGHGMLAAQARGIPVLTGCAQVGEVVNDQVVAFDPVTREFWPHPDDLLREDLERRNAERTASARRAQLHSHEPAITRSGKTIKVEANVGSVDDAQAAAQQGADGSGVVRTENIFAKDLAAPSVEMQTEVFVRLGQAIGGPITIRTWDPSGDKPLAFMPNQREDNPALGERGIRMMRRVPQIFRDQIKAALLAAQQIELQLMIPMVTDPDEMIWAREQIESVRTDLGVDRVPVGVMVEVPAAALRAAEFASLVDFISIGTNDLSQYTQAADRTNGAVRELARQDSPAVLELIRMTRAALPGLPMAVCGDLASDPAVTAALIGLGVDELSVRPGMVAEIKQAVRAV
ncbi:putative PEP-binding protein [Brooklawnia sp.]|uniref:putative PEP-binding protein n=1 Tax=Brooklawnia sp. TaxID=2699740 RepID=UPI00311E58CA